MKRSLARTSLRSSAAAALAASISFAACKSGDTTSPSWVSVPSGTYKGTFVAPGASGVITLTFPTAATAPASGPQIVTGQLMFTGMGTSVVLNGRYHPDSLYPLYLTGPGPTPTTGYTISSGTFAPAGPSQWEGAYFGPTGGGPWTATGGSGVQVLCGAYNRLVNGTAVIGTWNLVLSNTSPKNLTGVALPGAGFLLGTYTAGAAHPNTSISFTWFNDHTNGSATGDLTPPSGSGTIWAASGSWRVPVTRDSGFWSSSSSGC
jgi:hypothetical protein